jgi:hypothetical protein
MNSRILKLLSHLVIFCREMSEKNGGEYLSEVFEEEKKRFLPSRVMT